MKPEEEPLSGDTTQLLRDILQSKERKELENNNTIKSYCVGEDRENSEMISTMLRAKSNTSAANSDNDNWSVHADNYSGDDSDIDVDTEEQAINSELAEDHGSPEITDDNDMTNSLSPEVDQDSKEAKRARVENIITSMKPLSQHSNEEVNQTSPEIKRQKRKQYQPQQHDVKGFGVPEAKYRKVERAALQEHIQQLQNQLRAVKQKCDDLCEEEHQLHNAQSESLRNGFSENIEHMSNGCKTEKENCMKENGFDIIRNTCRSEWDPSHFIRQASKLVQEQEVLSKNSGKKSASAQTPDLHALANSIKTEIVEAINKVVDNAVNKILEKNVTHSKTSENNGHAVSTDAVKESTPLSRLDRKAEVTSSSFSEQPLETRHNISSRLSDKISAFEPLHRNDSDFPRITTSGQSNMPFHPPFPYYLPAQVMPPMYASEPEQTEALPLIVSTPKKKRTKVTDTRLSPRAKSALLQDSFMPSQLSLDQDRPTMMSTFPHLFPPMLPTSVAIPNPSLTHSDIMSFGMREHNFWDTRMMNHSPPHSDRVSPKSPADSYSNFRKNDLYENSQDVNDINHSSQTTSTLTPMHLRKAKLMFFYCRYPSSAILKVYFPDIKFNKNNTAQLVKWFSNFREFFYIQMEKYARQALAEGCKHADELHVSPDSELYRVLNLHYNRNNQIEVPDNFRRCVQASLREFFRSIASGKDAEPSWKKAIYKIIARLDDTLPEYFKSPNWMEQLGEV